MPHFFISPSHINGGRFVLGGSEARHLVKVLRLQPGDEIRLFDGTGSVYLAKAETVSIHEIAGVILAGEKMRAPALVLTLCVSVPKGDRFDWLIEKAAELGVVRIVPLFTERSAVTAVSPSKRERWNRLSTAASKQCGRADILEVSSPVNFREAIEDVPVVKGDAFALIPWEGEESLTVGSVLSGVPGCSRASVVIGPEGGFTLDEIAAARAAGIVPVTLGPRILRVETAGLLAAALVLGETGEYDRT